MFIGTYTGNQWYEGIWIQCLASFMFLYTIRFRTIAYWKIWFSTFLGGVILIHGLLGFTGWFVDIYKDFSWLISTKQLFFTTATQIFLGIGIFTFLGVHTYRKTSQFPQWMLATNFWVIFIGASCMCVAEISLENEFFRRYSSEKALDIKNVITSYFEGYGNSVKQEVEEALLNGKSVDKELERILQAYVLVNGDNLEKIVWKENLFSESTNSYIPRYLRGNEQDLAESKVIKGSVASQGKPLIFSVDIFQKNREVGSVNSYFSIDKLFKRILPKLFFGGYAVIISEDGRQVYKLNEEDRDYYKQLSQSISMTIFDNKWTITLWPTPSMVDRNYSPLAPLIFLIGFIVFLVLGSVVHFFLIARGQAVRAENANKSKSAFLLNISHEVRTPLNGIIGTASLIANTNLDPKQERFVQIINRSGKLLLDIIDDVLDISKLESGGLKLHFTSERLHQLVKDTVLMFAAKANDKGIDLILDFPRLMTDEVMIDSVRFKQVLNNLIGNAVKFTDEGYIYVKIRESFVDGSAMHLLIEVEDTGPGIPKKEQQRIFEKFGQVDGSFTKIHGGSGLGLSICKQLVGLMGGSMGLISSEGVGSNFWLELPLQRLSSRVDFSKRYEGSLRGKKILVISGDSKGKSVLIDYAKEWGMVTSSASSLFSVMDLLVEEREDTQEFYDFILIDGESIEVDAMEVESLLIAKNLECTSKYLLLTNMELMSMIDLSAISFVNVYSKPLTTFELVNLLEKMNNQTESEKSSLSF